MRRYIPAFLLTLAVGAALGFYGGVYVANETLRDFHHSTCISVKDTPTR